MLEDCFMIVCRGLPDECEAIWLVPITELKETMRLVGVKTFRELAESYVCDICRSKMAQAIFSIEAMQQLKLPDSARDR